MQHPTEVVLNIVNSPALPPTESFMTHKEVFYLGKAHMYICLSAYKSGVKGCFWGVFLGLFGQFV